MEGSEDLTQIQPEIIQLRSSSKVVVECSGILAVCNINHPHQNVANKSPDQTPPDAESERTESSTQGKFETLIVNIPPAQTDHFSGSIFDANQRNEMDQGGQMKCLREEIPRLPVRPSSPLAKNKLHDGSRILNLERSGSISDEDLAVAINEYVPTGP